MRNPYKGSLIVGVCGTVFTLFCAILVCLFSAVMWCRVVCVLMVVLASFVLGDTFGCYIEVDRQIKFIKYLRANPHILDMIIEEHNEKEKFKQE